MSQEIPKGLLDVRDDALEIAAAMYHCDRTGCKCGMGRTALDLAAVEVEAYVRDQVTAQAFCEGIVFMGQMAADVLPKLPPTVRIFTSLVLCEAMRRGGILPEDQIAAAVEKAAKRKEAPKVAPAMCVMSTAGKREC